MMSLDDWKNVFNKNTITSVIYKDNTVNKVILGSTTYWQRLTSISISGTAQVGQKFTASVTPSSTSPAYQWYRGSNAISGANGSSYTVTSSDVGYQLHCKATASGQTVDSNYSSTVYRTASTNFEHTWYTRSGVDQGQQEYTHTLSSAAQITSIGMMPHNMEFSNNAVCTIFGSTNNSNWTQLVQFSTSEKYTTKSVSNSTRFNYIKVRMSGATYGWWVDPDGMYYNCGYNYITVTGNYFTN